MEVVAIEVAGDSGNRSGTGISPDVRLKIGVSEVDAFINNGDYNVFAAGRDVPNLRRADLS